MWLPAASCPCLGAAAPRHRGSTAARHLPPQVRARTRRELAGPPASSCHSSLMLLGWVVCQTHCQAWPAPEPSWPSSRRRPQRARRPAQSVCAARCCQRPLDRPNSLMSESGPSFPSSFAAAAGRKAGNREAKAEVCWTSRARVVEYAYITCVLAEVGVHVDYLRACRGRRASIDVWPRVHPLSTLSLASESCITRSQG